MFEKLSRIRTDKGAISHLAIQLEAYGQEAPALLKKLYVTAPVEGLSINGFSDFINTRSWSISHVENPVYEEKYKIHNASSFSKRIPLSHLAYQKPDRYDANSNVISCLILTDTYGVEKKVEAIEPVIKQFKSTLS